MAFNFFSLNVKVHWLLARYFSCCPYYFRKTYNISFYLSVSAYSQRSNDWACAWFKHFWWLPVIFPFHHTKFPRSTSQSTSFTRTISVLRPIILPLQTFFSRVLLLRQQAFSSGNLPPERPTTTTTAIKTQVFMSCSVSLRTRKFDKKIHYCCRDSFFVEEDI